MFVLKFNPIKMNRHFVASILNWVLWLSVLLKAGWCAAATFTWNGSTSTDWFNSTNWIPVGVPASTDTIYFTNGTTINLTNTVTIAGSFNWSSGTLSGKPMTITSAGVLNISGSVSLENVLTNAGTVTMTGAAYLIVYNNNSSYFGGIYNQAGALWDIQTNASIACGYCSDEFFDNAGTFRKSGGSGTSAIDVGFTNSVLVTNLMGTLDFDNGGVLTGTYGTAAGATIDFAGGSFTMGTPPVITGLGVCEFTGTTLTLLQTAPGNLLLAGGSVVLGSGFQNGGSITNLTLNGATLPGTNTVTGTLNWASGTVSGVLTIAGGGVLNITGNDVLENVLTNAGTVTMSGAGELTIYNNDSSYHGGVYNQAGALWDIQTNASIACGYCSDEFFDNAGTFRKSGGSGTSAIDVGFTNSATVTALMGILSFNENFITTSGTLAFGVSGLANLGQVNVSGSVALNGTVSVTWLDGFTPSVGNSFTLLDYGSHSGTFASIILPAGSSGAPTYGATAFSLMITNVTTQTNPPVFLNINLVNPSTVVVSWPSSATNYTLQTNANLSSGSWGNVTSGISTVSTNDVFTNTVSGNPDFFRLQSP